jgi:hypothetical protein
VLDEEKVFEAIESPLFTRSFVDDTGRFGKWHFIAVGHSLEVF